MQSSIYIAKLNGPVMLLAGVAALINQRAFNEIMRDFLANRALLFLSGLFTMLAGVAIVLANHVWTGWPIIITVLGWLMIIGGAARMLAPEFVVKTGSNMIRHPRMPLIAGAVWVVIGLILCFFGYSR